MVYSFEKNIGTLGTMPISFFHSPKQTVTKAYFKKNKDFHQIEWLIIRGLED